MEKETKEKKPKKVIKHRIVDGRLVLGMILLTIVAYFVLSIVLGGGIGAIVGFVGFIVGFRAPQTALYVVAAICGFIMLAIHKRWFYPEFDSNIKPAADFGKWILVSFAILPAIIIPDLIIMLATKTNFAAPTLTSFGVALMAGTTEEIIFRAVPGSFGMREAKEEKDIIKVVIVTSVLFGLVHATNILEGAAVSSTLVQVVSAFGTGTLLCAVYLRSGNILPPMMIHFLYDVYALMNADSVTQSGVMEAGLTTKDLITNIILFVIEVSMACYLLRKSVRPDVMTVWEKKWNKHKAAPKAESDSEAEVC